MQGTNGADEEQKLPESAAPSLYVSNDRGLCTVRLILKDGFSLYKEALREKQAFFESGLLAAASFTAAPDGYCCAVKGGYSIKDYLGSGGEPDLPALSRLSEALGLLLKKCTEMNISPYDIIYDYRAVFTNAAFSDFKFIYMPGAAFSQSTKGCGELIKILFLHMYNVLPEREYHDLGNLVEMLSEAENQGRIIQVLQDIQLYTAQYSRNKKENAAEKLREWFKRYAQNDPRTNNTGKAEMKEEKRQGKHSGPIADGVLVIHGDIRLSGVYLEKTVYRNEDTVIKIGRDKKWSDVYVEDIMVSRHHAEICAGADKDVCIKDISLNGTVVDDISVRNNEIVKPADTDIKLFITEDCVLWVKYRTAAG